MLIQIESKFEKDCVGEDYFQSNSKEIYERQTKLVGWQWLN